jgi:hypothetical protein
MMVQMPRDITPSRLDRYASIFRVNQFNKSLLDSEKSVSVCKA